MMKYPWLRDLNNARPTNKEWRKFGADRADESRFDWVRRYEPGKVVGVEADIMDWADDITYAVHDLEDFYRARLVPLDRLLTSARERKGFASGSIARWKDEGGRPTGFRDDYLFEKFASISALSASKFREAAFKGSRAAKMHTPPSSKSADREVCDGRHPGQRPTWAGRSPEDKGIDGRGRASSSSPGIT